MNIPAIGVVRGLFDVFVPGTFLLLNLILVAYLTPFVDQDTKSFIKAVTSDSTLVLVIALCFGYLIGVLLRMVRTELPDRLSAAWLRRFHPRARRENDEFMLWAVEEFPYIGWIGEVCKGYLPPEAFEFYEKIWSDRKREGQNRQFFNFCKIMINSVDERAGTEFNAAEALSRYIAAMFFALASSSPLILITAILHYAYYHEVLTGLVAMLIGYLFAVMVILNYLRFLRIKEVEIVFAASFRNRSLFGEEVAANARERVRSTALDFLRELFYPTRPEE